MPRVEPPAGLAAQYETLRRGALGEPISPEARWGLGLFLRRGLWAWAQALAATAVPEPPGQATGSIAIAPYSPRAVIQVLAALALNTQRRRVS
jgi:hypothetical protein